MRLVREAERERITGVPRSTWWLRMKQGTAPKAIPIGPQARAWLESDLNDWVQQQVERRIT